MQKKKPTKTKAWNRINDLWAVLCAPSHPHSKQWHRPCIYKQACPSDTSGLHTSISEFPQLDKKLSIKHREGRAGLWKVRKAAVQSACLSWGAACLSWGALRKGWMHFN